jgi:predicted Zn-dependent protease
VDRASLNPPLGAADRVVVLGAVPPEWIPWAGAAERVPHENPDARRRLDVDALMRWARPRVPDHGRLVVVTDGDLFMPECDSLLGFSNHRTNVAIVSTARLATSDVARTVRRIVNAVTHELGHLEGLRHCARACVMRPVAAANELDDRPDGACGHCPRRRSKILAIVSALAVLLAIVGVTGRLLDRRVTTRPPAVPASLVSLLDELPADPGTVASRPVELVVQRLDATAPDALSRSAAWQASALYRTPEPQPIVRVHAFEARGDLDALLDALKAEWIDAVVVPRPPRHAVLIVAPSANAREMAARLASTVGTGLGLRHDADMSLMLAALPARLPDGYALDSLAVTNLHRVPEAIDETARRFFGDDGPAAAAQLRRVMPLAVITAGYRSADDARAGVMIGFYGLTPSAWMSRFTLARILKPWEAGTIDLPNGEAMRLSAGRRHYAMWRQGKFVAAVYAEGSTAPDVLLRALAGELGL